MALFHEHFERIYRYLDRLTGEAALAADLAQEAFIRLYRRGALPDAPAAWLISVAMNLLRNAKSTERRRRRLLTPARSEQARADPAPAPGQGMADEDTQRRVRAALDSVPERERRLLLLCAEGYSYREMAAALHLNEASVGVLLARAKRAFRDTYEDTHDAH